MKRERKYEWESIRVALDKMRESKGKYHKQQTEEERETAYAQIAQNIERTRAMVRNSISRASTISAEEHQLALTEDDFLVIQKKMDKTDQRLDDVYKNWHAEYRDAATAEECDEMKKIIGLIWKNMSQNIESYTIYYNNLVHCLHRKLLLA